MSKPLSKEKVQAQRNQLKIDIINWLIANGVTTKDLWVKALKAIKDTASDTPYRVDADLREANDTYLSEAGIADGVDVHLRLFRYFSPPRYAAAAAFVDRLIEIEIAEYESWEAAESIVQDFLDEQRRNVFFSCYEHDVATGEIIIRSDGVYVEAFEYQEGFKDMLPRGGQYQGRASGVWRYPLSKRKEFTTDSGTWHGMPVLYESKKECPYFTCNKGDSN